MKRFCLLAVALIGACEKDNPEYCLGAAHQSDPYCAGDAMPAGCMSNDQCSDGTSVCEVTSGTCVQCLAPDQDDACSGTTPVCGDDHACRQCSANADCASDACMPDGSCAAESDVAYVAPAGTGTQCTRTAPCGTLVDAIATQRPVAKMATGTVKTSAVTTIDGKKLTIVADAGAKLSRDTNGPILQVQSANAEVSIVGLEITGQSGSSDSAVVLTANGGTPKLSLTRCVVSGNQGTGITSTGGSLTISASTISSNTGTGITSTGGSLTVSRSTVSVNNAGGISVGPGTLVDITNNFIFHNGNGIDGLVPTHRGSDRFTRLL